MCGKRGLCSIALGALTLFCRPALGTPITFYSSDAALTAATAGLTPTIISFNGLASGGDVQYGGDFLRLGGVAFSASPAFGYGNGLYIRHGYGSPTGDFLSAPGGNQHGYLEVTLPAGVTAVRADVASVYLLGNGVYDAAYSPGVLTVTVGDGGSPFTLDPALWPAWTMFGVTSTTEITRLRFALDTAESPLLGSLTFYTAGSPPETENPEPESWMFAITGLVLIMAGAVRVRASRRSSSPPGAGSPPFAAECSHESSSHSSPWRPRRPRL